jgi:serine phosphatase RsbU (regulator of sigma subunit)/anti-sigma regulatory factor (Ser/Thr protein kinase)
VRSAATGAERRSLHWIAYGIVLALVAGVWALYGANLARWPDSPDYGWRTMYTSGPNVVAQVFADGAAAGLRSGDRVVAVNGRPYASFDELFFGGLRRSEPGSVNTYTVQREGATLEIAVPTGRVGLAAVLARSGPLFAVGVVYILIGALVFLMKPGARASWLFFLMTCCFGIGIGLSSPADLMQPTWLYDLRFLANVLIPATMIHLALEFPKPRAFVRRRPWVAVLPYLPSAAIFVLRQAIATEHWTVPKLVFLLWIGYTVAGILFFLASTGWNALRDASIITRLQSRFIFIGTILGFLIPALDLLSGTLWQVAIFSDPVLGFGVFFSLFPLSIGYTIVKHDLFAIDVIVRRTYGYVLSTAAIVGAYAAMISIVNVAFGAADAARSPLFAIGFALVVVFLFEPLHRRIQSFVDRTFYRQHYDYRTAIKSLSEAMTSILDPERILRTLAGAVVKEMVLENGVLLLPGPAGRGHEVAVAEGIDPRALPMRSFPETDPLLGLVKESKSQVLGHDIALNPAYDGDRPQLQRTLEALSSELLMPMLYKDELRGILSLGRKKSGKLFTPEDFDLLRTMLSQSAIALENARLFRENLQKERMEEELKIAHQIQMGMLPETAPRLEGLAIAARTIPAREVGGDFYDFVEFGPAASGARLGIIIADVSGKGVSAGLLMAGARSTYRVLLDGDPAVHEVMNDANRRLHQDIRKGMFVALLYAVLDPRARTLTLSNAGQTQPILCAPGAEPCHIATDGDTFPLGIVPDCEYLDTRLALEEGSVVVFYTDGAVEAMNAAQELYGFERFLASVQARRHLGATDLLDALFDDISRFAAGQEQHDDITIIVARIGSATPQGEPAPMASETKFELHLPSALGAEKRAMEFAAEVAAKMGFPRERIDDLKTAVAEACINAIEHGNRLQATTKVGIRLTADAERLLVAVHDKGSGIVKKQGSPDLESRIEGRADPRGWGIFLMESLVDEVSFETTSEGNVVKMIIYLDTPQ